MGFLGRERFGGTNVRVLCVALGAALGCATAHAAVPCESLLAVTPEASTVTGATSVAAGTVISGQTVPVAMCRVQGTARPTPDSEIKWEVWLPQAASAWTGRMKVNGTG